MTDVSTSAETQRRALSVEQFCKRYGIGKSTLYVQIREGRLRLRKIGKRSVIAVEDAEIWFMNLRTVDPAIDLWSHKPCSEANGSAQCGKSARCVRRGGDWKRGTVERPAGAPVLDPT